MKIINTEKNNTDLTVSLEFEPSAVEALFDNAYKIISKKIKLNGFRPGKVPRDIFERRFGDQAIWDKALLYATENAYHDSLTELGETPVTKPFDIKLDADDRNKPIQFTYTVSVEPVITLDESYKTLELPELDTTVTEADIDAELDSLRQRYKTLEPSDEPIKSGDIIECSMQSGVDGPEEAPFALWTQDRTATTIGENVYGPDFDAALIGCSAHDEKKITLVYDETALLELVRNKTIRMTIQVLSVSTHVLPEVTDEFIKRYTGHDTLEAYKDYLKSALPEQKEAKNRGDKAKYLFDYLIETHDIHLPDVMIDRTQDSLFENYKHRVESNGFSFEQYCQYMGLTPEQEREKFRDEAIRENKERCLIKAIAKADAIVPEKKDYEAMFKVWLHRATQGQQLSKKEGERAVRAVLKSIEANRDQFNTMVLSQKVITVLVDKTGATA